MSLAIAYQGLGKARKRQLALSIDWGGSVDALTVSGMNGASGGSMDILPSEYPLGGGARDPNRARVLRRWSS